MNQRDFLESAEYFLDVCPGLLHEIPQSFDNGRTPVQLSTIAVSKSFIAMGSNCGALFPYNRNLDRTARPMKTPASDAVTSIELFADNEKSCIAVGRVSGTVIIMCIPFMQHRTIRQSVQEKLHGGSAVTLLRWSPDGNRLYSADSSGQMMAIDVDFNNEMYSSTFMGDTNAGIKSLDCTLEFVVYATSSEITWLHARNGRKMATWTSDAADRQVLSVRFVDDHPVVLLSDGVLYRLNGDGCLIAIYDHCSTTVNEVKSVVEGTVVVGGKRLDDAFQHSSFSLEDFKTAQIGGFHGFNIFLWSADKCLVVNLESGAFKTFSLTDLVDNDLLEITFGALDATEGTIFFLTRQQEVLRLGTTPPSDQLLMPRPPEPVNTASRIDSFVSAAQMSSLSWSPLLGRLTETFKNPPANLADSLTRLTLDSGTRLASGFRDVIKKSQLISDFDATAGPTFAKPELAGEALEDPIEPEDLVSAPIKIPKSEITVDRRSTSKVQQKSDDVYGLVGPDKEVVASQSDHSYTPESNGFRNDAQSSTQDERVPDNIEAASDSDEEGKDDEELSEVPDDTLDAIIRGNFELKPEDDFVDDGSACESDVEVPDPTPGPAESSAEAQVDVVSSENFISPESPVDETEEFQTDVQASASELRVSMSVDDEHPVSLSDACENSSRESLASSEAVHDELDILAAAEDADNKDLDAAPSLDNEEEGSRATPSIPLPKELVLPEYSHINAVANHRTDSWRLIRLPYGISTFHLSSSYIVVLPSRPLIYSPHYLSLKTFNSDRKTHGWKTAKIPSTDGIFVNDSGNLLWRVRKGAAHAAVEPSLLQPSAASWQKQTDGSPVSLVALNSRHAWYVTEAGVCVQMFLPDMGIIHQTDCRFRFSSIAASDHAVWGLTANGGTLVARASLSEHMAPMGLEWIEMDVSELTGRLVSIALFDRTGFGIDRSGQLWFVNGVDQRYPFGAGPWFRVCQPTVLGLPFVKKQAVSSWVLRVSSYGVVFSVGSHLVATSQPITGHHLSRVIPSSLAINDAFSLVSASGPDGIVFACLPSTEIFVFRHDTRKLSTIPHFHYRAGSEIVAIASAANSLYAVDGCGAVFVRRGFNASVTPLGISWDQVDTPGPVASIAASSHSLWVVTSDGGIFQATDGIRVGTTPLWTKVNAPSGPQCDKVAVSPSGKYVWLVSTSSGEAFAREDVTETNQWRGTKWTVALDDVKVTDVAVGDNVVWAVAAGSRKLLRLQHLSLSNVAGAGWRVMPFVVRAVSVNATESRLWAVDDDGHLVKHVSDVYPRSCIAAEKHQSPGNVQRNSESSWVDLTEVGSDGDSEQCL